MAVREVRAWSPVTRLTQAPRDVVGVVNLRGTVLPVADLASRLGWEETEATPRLRDQRNQVGATRPGFPRPHGGAIAPSAMQGRGRPAAPG